MKFGWFLPICLLLTTVAHAEDQPAADRRLEFLNALRERTYYDYALLYLDQLAERKDLPDEIRQILPLERGLTLLEEVRDSSASAAQHTQLDQARGELERFLKEHPNHERAAQANSELGQVFVQKGRVDVFQSRSLAHARNKDELRQSAREYFRQARDVFAKAVAQHKAAYDKFDVHIDERQFPQLFEERRQVEQNYLQAQFNLAHVTFYESETYDDGSDENKKLLQQAANEFEEIHAKYHGMIVGLYSRMWQGKCYEELGETRQALGLYNELLGHPGENESLANLKDAVQRFRMACLNARNDSALVIKEADAWLKDRGRQRHGSRDHVGILWERVVARESLAKDEKTEERERNRMLRDAIDDLRYIKSHSIELRDAASDKERIIAAHLNLADKDPEEFEVALGLGLSQIKLINGINDKLRDAQARGDAKAVATIEQERAEVVTEAARILNIALRLADDDTEAKDLNQARYLLAVAYFFLDDREYDAAVIGEFIARRYKDATPDVALDAAYLSMTAYIEAFNANRDPAAAPEAEAAELRPVIEMAELITTTWPKRPKADDARMRLGEFYNRLKQFEKAAKYFQEVDKSSDQYLDAQLKAGQAYWNAYVAAAPSDAAAVDDKTKQEWIDQARQLLVAGITKKQENLPADAAPSETLVYAKLTLAMIQNETGDFPAAVELLAGGKSPVLPQVAATGARPEQGIKSAKFATAAYQQALRAYVGTRDIPKAQAVLRDLEGMGSGDALIGQLVQLGKQLQEEVGRLRSRNDPRLPEVVKSFEDFLTAMYERDNQTIQSLYWVGLTYFDLGQGLSNGKFPPPAEAIDKFSRSAAVFSDALKRYEADPTLATASQVADLKLRLVRALHYQGQFEQAQQLVTEILTKRPRAIDVQMEAAMLLTDWAKADPAGAGAHLTAAIGGVNAAGGGEKVIWGWGLLSQKLMTAVLQGSDEQKNEEFVEMFAESRYWLAYCRRQLGLAQAATDEQVRLLEMSLLDITSTVRAGADISGTPWWSKFNTLNKDIHTDLGRAVPPDLTRPTSVVAVVEETPEAIQTPQDAADGQSQAVAAPSAAAPESSGNLTLLIAGVLTLAFVGVLAYLIVTSGKKKTRRYR